MRCVLCVVHTLIHRKENDCHEETSTDGGGAAKVMQMSRQWVPHRRTGNREGPTTISTQPVGREAYLLSALSLLMERGSVRPTGICANPIVFMLSLKWADRCTETRSVYPGQVVDASHKRVRAAGSGDLQRCVYVQSSLYVLYSGLSVARWQDCDNIWRCPVR